MWDIDDGSTRVAFAGDLSNQSVGLRTKFVSLYDAGITRLHHVGVLTLGFGPADAVFLDRVNAWAEAAGIGITLTGGVVDDWARLAPRFVESGGTEPLMLRSNIAALPIGFRWAHRRRTFVSSGAAPSVNLWQRPDEQEQYWQETLLTKDEFQRITSGNTADVLIAADSPIPGTPTVIAIRGALGHWADDLLIYAEMGTYGINAVMTAVDPFLIVHAGFGVKDEGIRKDRRRVVSLTAGRDLGSVLVLDLVTMATSWLGEFDV